MSDGKSELRAAIRTQIHLGHYSVDEVQSALFRAQGDHWIWERIDDFVDHGSILRDVIRTQLGHERRKADRETPTQRRLRLDRQRAEAVELGLVEEDATAEDADRVPAHTFLVARINSAVETLRRETIEDFFTDMLIPQSVPGKGWKRRADLTREDCLAVAADYEKRAVTETGMAFAFATFADALAEQGVKTLGQLDTSQMLVAA